MIGIERARLLLALFALAPVALVSVGAAQRQGGGRGNFMNNFTGDVEIGDSSDMRMSRITFAAGARTNWHVHSVGQLLHAEEGRGRWQEQGGEVKEFVTGQPVFTRPNVPHWHGAAPDQSVVQFSVYSGTLEWQQPVTDAQYMGK
jgi:quercetin dioxygenase-like cupin family protein